MKIIPSQLIHLYLQMLLLLCEVTVTEYLLHHYPVMFLDG